VVARRRHSPYIIRDTCGRDKGETMTSFEDREKAFENQFARDAELQFRIIARRNRLVGAWAAAKMGLTPEEADAYAKTVVQADFEEVGDEDVIRKLVADFAAAGMEVSDEDVRAALAEKAIESRRQFIEGV
jgi:hypothetical protein